MNIIKQNVIVDTGVIAILSEIKSLKNRLMIREAEELLKKLR